MCNPPDVDGSRLASLCVQELRVLLDLRVKAYHQHLDEYRNDSCAENNFTFIKQIVEVLNAMQNTDTVMRDGSIKPGCKLTLFQPPYYKDNR